ncbi:pilus assembly protein [Phenylobacterium sp. LjRoot219]|uniref:TadE/TadG family type IV pilus assembly protein n=1 Tax=Phenylobacterium sp. LjRoot219 TaxID=3342283 RepID=UPI003ECCA645
MSLRANFRRLRAERSGAALVEFTLVAPLLIALMCGLAEFGQALRQYHVMQKGVGDAARYLARAPARPPCMDATDPNWATYVGEAQNLAVKGVPTGGTALFNGWSDTASVSVPAPTCLTNPRGSGSDLPLIIVTASAPYADLGMLSALGFDAITLTVSHQELKVS